MYYIENNGSRVMTNLQTTFSCTILLRHIEFIHCRLTEKQISCFWGNYPIIFKTKGIKKQNKTEYPIEIIESALKIQKKNYVIRYKFCKNPIDLTSKSKYPIPKKSSSISLQSPCRMTTSVRRDYLTSW